MGWDPPSWVSPLVAPRSNPHFSPPCSEPLEASLPLVPRRRLHHASPQLPGGCGQGEALAQNWRAEEREALAGPLWGGHVPLLTPQRLPGRPLRAANLLGSANSSLPVPLPARGADGSHCLALGADTHPSLMPQPVHAFKDDPYGLSSTALLECAIGLASALAEASCKQSFLLTKWQQPFPDPSRSLPGPFPLLDAESSELPLRLTRLVVPGHRPAC